ncbi:MAG: hypothetical protein IE935_11370 [Micrococcales bacterium]|nr:hypothetical protein [Micrococcales bacterium]
MTVGAWLAASVLEARPAAVGARTLVLDVPDWPGNLPGQHLDLRLTAEDGYQAVRSYSIASFGSGTAVELGVDEVEDGEVSPYLVEDVRAGDQMEVKGPLGQYFVWDATDPSPVQLIAGGSGIVPLIAMVRAHVAADASASMRLVYSVKDADRAMYRDELLAPYQQPRGRAWSMGTPSSAFSRRPLALQPKRSRSPAGHAPTL